MTTDKIRAAAQMLLEAHDSIAPLREMSSGWDQLRAAIAEPAQSAPADDAVPVVMLGRKTLPDGRYDHEAQNVPLVSQSDHLAAMEALRQDRMLCGHHRSLTLKSAETGKNLYCELCDATSGRRDAEQMEADLRQEVERLKADLAFATAHVRKLMDGDA